MSRAENFALIEAARAGIVREASLLVTTGDLAEHAVELVKKSGIELGIGLHFSLTEGRPLAGAIRGLTDGDTSFASLRRVLAWSLAQAIDEDAVEAELRAQLRRLEELGFSPTHLNGHHHVQVFPGVR